MPDAVRVAIIAALEREISPLVKGWKRSRWVLEEGTWIRFTKGDVVVIVAGPGRENAGYVAGELLRQQRPELVVSAGFAGATAAGETVGDVVVPAKVCDGDESFETAFGMGVLATVHEVASRELKQEQAERYGACVLDMEASAVAKVAQKAGVKFAAVKAVSDTLADEDIAVSAPFVKPEGFDMAGFLKHIGPRPHLWPAVARLKRNSEQAGSELCKALRELLKDPETFAAQASGGCPAEISTRG